MWNLRCGKWGAALTEGHQPRLQGTSQHGLQLCLLPQFHSLFALTLVSTKTRLWGTEVPPIPLLAQSFPSGHPQFSSGNTYALLSQPCSKPFTPVARAVPGCETTWESYWWSKSHSQPRAHSGSTRATGVSTHNGPEGKLVSSTDRLSLSVVCS